jgi:hypothetical protein
MTSSAGFWLVNLRTDFRASMVEMTSFGMEPSQYYLNLL